jgi:sugar transferase (PEP-CTERM system associated)
VKRWAIALVLIEIGLLTLSTGGGIILATRPLLLTWPNIITAFLQVIAPAFCIAVSFYYNDLYDLRTVRSFGMFVARLPQALGIGLLLLAVVYKAFPHLAIDRDRPILSSLGEMMMSGGMVLPIRWVLYRFMRIRAFAERVLILGTSPLARKIAKEIEAAPHTGYLIVGFVDDQGSVPTQAVAEFPSHYCLFAPLDRLEEIIGKLQPDRLIVALTERRGRLPVRDLLNARMNGVIVEDGIEVHERFTEKLAIESLTPSFLFFSRDFTKSRFKLALQRAMSLTVAVLGLIVTSPLMVLVAMAIKIDSEGPIFFIQERAGLRGKPFRLMKFRTMRPAMIVEEEDGAIWNRNSNGRITRVGKVLRKLRFDELPQFINILRGDMDLVGPRPEMMANVKIMTEQIPYYSLRMVVRPGITGWAQVKHGYSINQEDVTEKMRYDLYYVKHMSLWFDLKILLDTVKLVLLGKGSEAQEGEEKLASPRTSLPVHSPQKEGKHETERSFA